MLGFWLMGMLGVGILVAAFSDDDDSSTGDGDDTAAPPALDMNLIEGTEGADTLMGTSGDDAIVAHGGDDVVTADAGMDLVAGEGGDDLLQGGDGDDLILGGLGSDTVLGEAGDDILSVADIFDEETYVTDLLNGADPDTIDPPYDFDRETGEADTVDGGAGDDVILFGSNDEVTGGDGFDVFGTGDWASSDAPATVTDFDPARDVLSFAVRGDAFPFVAFGEENGTAVLQVDGETVVYLPGVIPGTLDMSHLVLVGIPLPGQI